MVKKRDSLLQLAVKLVENATMLGVTVSFATCGRILQLANSCTVELLAELPTAKKSGKESASRRNGQAADEAKGVLDLICETRLATSGRLALVLVAEELGMVRMTHHSLLLGALWITDIAKGRSHTGTFLFVGRTRLEATTGVRKGSSGEV